MTKPKDSPHHSNDKPAEEKRRGGISRIVFFGFFLLLLVMLVSMPLVALYTDSPFIKIFFAALLFFSAFMRFKNIGYDSILPALLCFVPVLNIYTLGQALVLPEAYRQHKTIDLSAKISLVFYAVFIVFIVLLIVSVWVDEYFPA